MKKIILTGYEGFIGRNFLEKIKAEGTEVIEVERRNAHHFTQYFNDWKDVYLILHQGAISSTTCTNLRSLQSFNINFTEWLFEKAIEHKIPLKYASSASVYGNQKEIYNPLNYYALSKLTMDYWVEDHIDEFAFVQGFRYFNVYGKYEEKKIKENQSSPVSKFIHQAKEEGKVEIFKGSKNFFRDFICVDDVVDIVLNNNKASGIYDLGTSKPISFFDVAESISSCYNVEVEEITFPEHLKGKYQGYTCAKEEWDDYQFKTVKEYDKDSMD